MLKYRLITGPLLILALLGIFFVDDRLDTTPLPASLQDLFGGAEYPPRGIVLFLLGLFVMPLAAVELSRIVRHNDIATRPWLMSVAAMTGLTVSYVIPAGLDAVTTVAIVATAMVAVFVLALLTFSRHQNVEGVVAATGAVIFAMIYLGLMLGFLIAIRREHSAWWIVGIIFMTKSCDTGAYFTGRAIGRRKLIPWLSPGKTWEGLAGGVATAIGAGILVSMASNAWLEPHDHIGMGLGIACGAVCAVVGQCGDLTMSLFKRGAGIKDSSTILPGLGGVLDVLDSPLLVAPVAFWMLTRLT